MLFAEEQSNDFYCHVENQNARSTEVDLEKGKLTWPGLNDKMLFAEKQSNDFYAGRAKRMHYVAGWSTAFSKAFQIK